MVVSMRDDFSQQVKETLAKRVGYKCSNPFCQRATIGPNSVPNKSTTIGIACHICAASKGGPRYDSMMTSTERASIENGIWLCSCCSDLIDKDPNKYPVSLLHEWKDKAEISAEKEILSFEQRNETNFVWEPTSPLINNNPCKQIEENIKEYNLFRKAFNNCQEVLNGKETLIMHIWKFVNTPKYEYKIYSKMYGTEYSELLATNNPITFQRLAPLMANEIMDHSNFCEWVSEIFGIRKSGNKLLMDFGVKGNRGRIISVNLLWQPNDTELLSYEND